MFKLCETLLWPLLYAEVCKYVEVRKRRFFGPSFCHMKIVKLVLKTNDADDQM